MRRLTGVDKNNSTQNQPSQEKKKVIQILQSPEIT